MNSLGDKFERVNLFDLESEDAKVLADFIQEIIFLNELESIDENRAVTLPDLEAIIMCKSLRLTEDKRVLKESRLFKVKSYATHSLGVASDMFFEHIQIKDKDKQEIIKTELWLEAEGESMLESASKIN